MSLLRIKTESVLEEAIHNNPSIHSSRGYRGSRIFHSDEETLIRGLR